MRRPSRFSEFAICVALVAGALVAPTASGASRDYPIPPQTGPISLTSDGATAIAQAQTRGIEFEYLNGSPGCAFVELSRITGTGKSDPDGSGRFFSLGSRGPSFFFIRVAAGEYAGAASIGGRILVIRAFVIGSATLYIPTRSLKPATVGAPYRFALRAAGGTRPYSWNAPATGGLPPGLTLSASGVITGTPTEMGSFPIHLQVNDTPTTSGPQASPIAIARNLPLTLVVR